MIGVVPILGTASAICIVVAYLLKLNQVAIQVSNYVVYPFQFLLIIPLVRIGETLFGLEPTSFDPTVMASVFSESFTQGLSLYGKSLLIAVTAWAVFAIPVIILLRFLLIPVLRRIA